MYIPTKNNIKTVTDMREDPVGLLDNLDKTEGPTVIFHHNRPMGVLMAVDQYNKLTDIIEDYIDGELAAELEKEPIDKKDYVALEEVARKLKIKL